LIGLSNDYLWYGQLVETRSGVAAPSLGVCRRHFRLTPRADAENARFAPTPAMAGARAVVDLVQHADRRWQVLHVEVALPHRRQGVATVLYDLLTGHGWHSTSG
jgi:hypothetical protein